jgi:hypothetical protein
MNNQDKLLEIVLDLSMRVFLLENTLNKILIEKNICTKEELQQILKNTQEELESIVENNEG